MPLLGNGATPITASPNRVEAWPKTRDVADNVARVRLVGSPNLSEPW